MKRFLEEVARVYYENEFKVCDGSNLSDYAFVFPNRRAGLFFRRYLSGFLGGPVFSPSIFTISEFFERYATLKRLDDVSLLFRLYDCYKEVCAELRRSGEVVEERSFLQFMSWGESLLSDFNDVDNEHADARQLFGVVADLKEIDAAYGGLPEATLRALKEFWGDKLDLGDGEEVKIKRDFVSLWRLIYPLYERFTRELRAEGAGYEGLVFKDALEYVGNVKFKRVVFAGFNALNRNEQGLFEKLRGVADYYWDADSVFVDADYAGVFVMDFRNRFPSRYKLDLGREDTGKDQHFELIPVPSVSGQAAQIGRILSENGEVYSGLDTAVALPDETMLLPVLHDLPDGFESVNVTMGYPLSLVMVHSLVHDLLTLQENMHETKDGRSYCYYKYLLKVLNHPLLRESCDFLEEMSNEVVEKRLYNVYSDDFDDVRAREFANVVLQRAENFIGYLRLVLDHVNTEDNEVERVLMGDYRIILNQLERNLERAGRLFSRKDTERVAEESKDYLRVLRRLIDQVVSAKRVAFEGEPLSGLQVIGILETRSLDFENVIIPSMNEDVFPKRQSSATVIPYSLRRAFGLPTYERQDKVAAYYFFRLVSRAKNVHILYNTSTEGVSTGEESRFVKQLRLLNGVKMEDTELFAKFENKVTEPIEVTKSPEVMEKLKSVAEKGFSPSALKSYIECPLRFYLSSVERIKEPDELTESVKANVFGSILHLAMEMLYKPYVGKWVDEDVIKILKARVGAAVKFAFNIEYLKVGRKLCADEVEYRNLVEELKTNAMEKGVIKSSKGEIKIEEPVGQYELYMAVIERYVADVLDYDRRRTPFKYICSEESVRCEWVLSDGSKVNLYGKIDRVDEGKDGKLHIVDYKTGADKLKFKSVESLFSPKETNGAAFQTLMYSLLYCRNNGAVRVEPNVYKVKGGLRSDDYSPRLVNGKVEVSDYSEVAKEYEERFTGLLDEIMSPEKSFTQEGKTNTQKCKYCPFKELCGVEVKEYD